MSYYDTLKGAQNTPLGALQPSIANVSERLGNYYHDIYVRVKIIIAIIIAYPPLCLASTTPVGYGISV
jgi:hypothetical protein